MPRFFIIYSLVLLRNLIAPEKNKCLYTKSLQELLMLTHMAANAPTKSQRTKSDATLPYPLPLSRIKISERRNFSNHMHESAADNTIYNIKYSCMNANIKIYLSYFFNRIIVKHFSMKSYVVNFGFQTPDFGLRASNFKALTAKFFHWKDFLFDRNKNINTMSN